MAGLYERFILPRLVGCACASRPLQRRRPGVISQAVGVVVEMGFGAGANLPFYEAGRVERIIAVEPSREMLALNRAARRTDIAVEDVARGAEDTGLPDACADTVVITFSLCTIPAPDAALREARRLLKPGGRLLFLEHGRAPDPAIARQQRLLEPVWRRLAGGCHLTRDPVALIEAAGFVCEQVESSYLPRTPRFAGYASWGAAAPPGGQA